MGERSKENRKATRVGRGRCGLGDVVEKGNDVGEMRLDEGEKMDEKRIIFSLSLLPASHVT